MTTNLLIGHPDIPFEAGLDVVDPAAETGFDAENVVTGDRHEKFVSGTETTEHEVGFLLATEREPNYVYIARADLIANAGTVRLRVQLSDDGLAWGTLVDENPLSISSLVGNNNEDFFSYLGSGAGSARWFRVLATSSDNFILAFSKFYIGSLFDFGRDPVYEIARGYTTKSRKDRRARRVLTLTWKAITDSKRADYIDKIGQYKDVNPIVLYDTNNLILEGLETFHCQIIEESINTIWNNNNEIVLTLEECI